MDITIMFLYLQHHINLGSLGDWNTYIISDIVTYF